MNIKKIVENLNIEEKIKLLGGYKEFYIHPIERFKLPEIKMADGPMGINQNGESTAFPASIALAATWNKEISYKVGDSLGKECSAKKIGVLLAPGVNIYRYHQNGRNFEYMGEDPCLASKMVVPFIKGVQENGVIATVKHFVANNQDYERHYASSNIDRQALEEIYFPAFKAAVQEADVKAVMMSYNPINGVQASENSFLINQILRKEWGFTGIVMSDWVSVYSEDAFNAGLDLEMPSADYLNKDKLLPKFEDKTLDIKVLNEKVLRILSNCYEMGLYEEKNNIEYNSAKHKEISCLAADESIVLLKNNNILPLNSTKNLSIAIVGIACKKIPASGGGAALVKEFCNNSLMDEFQKFDIDFCFFEQVPKKGLENYDYVITAVGFDKNSEGEAIDRSFVLPQTQLTTLDDICKQNSNLITLIFAGGGIELSESVKKSKAMLHCWYPGEEGAKAIVDIILGKVNPSGKLPFSWEKNNKLSPVYDNYKKMTEEIPTTGSYNFSGIKQKNYDLEYNESINFGNRYYKSEQLEFPFGFGLSYSKFKYTNLKLNKEKYNKDDAIIISGSIINESDFPGKEVIQIYIKNLDCEPERDFYELKEFQKVFINSNATENLVIELKITDLKHFNNDEWLINSGKYNLKINEQIISFYLATNNTNKSE